MDQLRTFSIVLLLLMNTITFGQSLHKFERPAQQPANATASPVTLIEGKVSYSYPSQAPGRPTLFQIDVCGEIQTSAAFGRVSMYGPAFEVGGKHCFIGIDGDGSAMGKELYCWNGSTVELVQDLWPGSGNGVQSDLYLWNGMLYFQGATASISKDFLYAYDGTNAIQMIADLSAVDYADPNIYSWAGYQNKLYFSATHDDMGAELWVYDGTNPPQVTFDLNPNGSAMPHYPTEYNGELYLRARSANSGDELWKFDGTAFELAADILPGTFTNLNDNIERPNSSYPTHLTVFHNKLFFAAGNVSPDPMNGGSLAENRELWSFDTINGAVQVADLWPGNHSSNPQQMTVYDGQLFVTAAGDGEGYELWSYDGTNAPQIVAGTTLPGYKSLWPLYFFEHASGLYFRGREANTSGWVNYRLTYPDTAYVSTCDSFSSTSGNQVWYSSGVYLDTLIGGSACGTDSVFFVNLTIAGAAGNCNSCDSLQVMAMVRHALCDSMGGSIELMVTGTGPYTFFWSTGDTMQMLSGAAPGAYDVTVTDACGSTQTISTMVSYQIEWTNLNGVFINDNQLTKSGSTGWNAGAESRNRLMAGEDGGISFQISEITNDFYMIGLSEYNFDDHFSSIEYAFYYRQGELRIMESGRLARSLGNLQAGDVLTIERMGNLIHYKQNGNSLHSVNTDAARTLALDVSILKKNTHLEQITATFCAGIIGIEVLGESQPADCSSGTGSINITAIGGAAPLHYIWSTGATSQDVSGLSPGRYFVSVSDGTDTVRRSFSLLNAVHWAALAGLTLNQTDGSLFKTTGSGWGTGAGSSLNELAPGQNGCLSFAADRVISHDFYTVGLSAQMGNGTLDSAGYAFYVKRDQLLLFENGRFVQNEGTLTAGETLGVCISAGQVSWMRNGQIIRTVPSVNQHAMRVNVGAVNMNDRIPEVRVDFCGLQARVKAKTMNLTASKELNVQIIPNPSSERFRLGMTGQMTSTIHKIRVIDQSGKTMVQFESSRTDLIQKRLLIDAAGWQAGIYQVIVSNGAKRSKVMRFVKTI